MVMIDMTDKYEEFKKWFLGFDDCDIPRKTKLEEIHHPMMTWSNPVYARTEYDRKRIFEKFEEEQEKEEEIKQTILDAIMKTPLKCEYIPSEVGKRQVYLTEPVVNKIYDLLNEKDLIK